uniref:DNA damage inducible transcript 3 n=1 Tax=Pelodiscus sinensis TaxID=13735 RepID=K7FE47_PELSI
MAAEPVSASLPSWELEAWYEDLQEVLSSDEHGGPGLPPGGVEQKDLATLDATALLWGLDPPGPLVEPTEDAPGSCELESSLTAEPPDSSPRTPGGGKGRGSSQPQGQGRKRSREEQSERRVTELLAENERLKQEIERLSVEVEATRAALIERMVNLRKA